MDKPVRLAILGSGNGTNAQQISEYFAGRTDVEVACIIYNKRDAYIAQRARNLGIGVSRSVIVFFQGFI